jgi:dGTPase
MTLEAFAGPTFRRYEETEDTIIKDPFLNDYTKIIQSKSYRRLAQKTQVLSLPDNPHVRTRQVHTEEVVSIAIAIAEQLRLNTYLCMAIAAGHDIGHTPFGHLGEQVLSEIGKKPFKHYVNSVVVAQEVERKGKGLNLTLHTLEGMLNHSRGLGELHVAANLPQEYAAVMFADKIAYTFSDLNDAVRYGHIEKNDVPQSAYSLGDDQRERTNTVLLALIAESKKKGVVSFSEGSEYESFAELRSFMNTYYLGVDRDLHKIAMRQAYEVIAELPETQGCNPILLTSLLTDKEVQSLMQYCLISRKPSFDLLKNFGISELLPFLKDKTIDYSQASLDWSNPVLVPLK